MFCEICKANKYGYADVAGSFRVGCKTFQVRSVNIHASSRRHKREEAAHDAANTPAEQRPADQMLMRMNGQQLDRMTIKCRTIHAMIKHMRPYQDFVWLNRLDRLKGIDVGTEYATDKTAATLAYYIAEVQ